MKFKTKKGLIAIILVLITMCGISAQSTEYAALFEQAKKYEADQKYVYALCTYYDVVAANDTNAKVAYECYAAIEEVILSGKPGFGEYNEFTLRDGWIALRIEFEKYWSENSTCYFKPGSIKKGDVNYENRTAKYTVSLKTEYTEKYNIINNIFKTGFGKVKKDDWGFNWSLNTIFFSEPFRSEDESTSEIYKKYGVALIKYPALPGGNVDFDGCDFYYGVYGIPFGKGLIAPVYIHPAIVPFVNIHYFYPDSIYIKDWATYYLIKLSIYDSKNAPLIHSCFNAPEQGKEWGCTFKDVDSSTMARIDAGGCYVKVDEIILKYGDYSFAQMNSNLQYDLKPINLPPIASKKRELNEIYLNTYGLKGAENYIKSYVCTRLKESKKATQEELIEYAKKSWKAWYNSEKEKFEKSSKGFPFFEYDESYAETVYKNEIENILVTANKKGAFVLTPEGKEFLK